MRRGGARRLPADPGRPRSAAHRSVQLHDAAPGHLHEDRVRTEGGPDRHPQREHRRRGWQVPLLAGDDLGRPDRPVERLDQGQRPELGRLRHVGMAEQEREAQSDSTRRAVVSSDGSYLTFQNSNISGRINKGVPPNGDFTPRSVVGLRTRRPDTDSRRRPRRSSAPPRARATAGAGSSRIARTFGKVAMIACCSSSLRQVTPCAASP